MDSRTHIRQDEIASLLARLVDRSLANYEERSSRFALIQMVRAYGQQLSTEHQDGDAWRDRHFAYYRRFCQGTDRKVRGSRQIEWLRHYDAEADNLRAALDWGALRPQLWQAAVEIATELLDYWIIRARFVEAKARFEQLLKFAPPADTEHRALALSGLASCLRYCRLPGALEAHTQALELAHRSGNPRALALAAYGYAYTLLTLGRTSEASRVLGQYLPLLREADKYLEVYALIDFGFIAQSGGEIDRAEAFYLEALNLSEQQGDVRGIGGVYGLLAQIAEARGDMKRAAELYGGSIRMNAMVADLWSLSGVLGTGCCSLWLEGRYADGAKLLGCADVLLEQIGAMRDPSGQSAHERWTSQLRSQLGDENFWEAYQSGKALTWEEGVALALGDQSLLAPEP